MEWCRRRPAHAALIAITMMLSFAALAVTAVGRHVERRRIDRLKSEVAELVQDGQMLLEQNEFEMAYGRFHEAWMTVQAEPALADHQPGVGGWLDHSRRAVNKEQWKQRVPPREFDERRDMALLESLLQEPAPDQPIAAARDAIHSAMELTLKQDPAWQIERERLTLVEAELIARDGSALEALNHLDSTHEFASRLFHQQRAAYLTQLGRESDANEALEQANTFPPDEPATLLMNGMNHVRRRDFTLALVDLEKLLNIEPDHYPARLFQAICFLNLKRPAEARVALTACIAQRPRLHWNYYFRAIANSEIGDRKSAASDLARVLELNPSETVRTSTQRLLKEIEANVTATPRKTSSAH